MTTIWVTGQYEAVHYWPNASGRVAYLKHPHRHIFKYRVEVKVKHNDRQIEFISLKEKIDNYCSSAFWVDITTYSCEQMCELIRDFLLRSLDLLASDIVSITVSEDGENGATWYSVK